MALVTAHPPRPTPDSLSWPVGPCDCAASVEARGETQVCVCWEMNSKHRRELGRPGMGETERGPLGLAEIPQDRPRAQPQAPQ